MHDQPPIQHTDQQQPSGRSGQQRLNSDPNQSGGLEHLLLELRVLLQGVQVLTGFLIVLPFYPDFARITLVEKWVYLTTFACALCSLILFSAPAAQHRLEWPLVDRVRFKVLATRMIIIGLVPFSLALILATQLVVAQVLGTVPALFACGAVAALIGAVWWLFPLLTRQKMAR